jgi:hypothetical protein
MSAVPVIPAQSPGRPAPRAASIGRRVYDVAVIGPHTGGAAAAALIARRGLRVLLAPLGTPSLARESEGWLLPTAHPLLPPLRQLTGAGATIDELGLGQELHRQTSAPGLLGDKLRLSLPAEQARRRAELRRELPEAEAQQAEAELESLEILGHAWDPFLAALPPYPARGFFERRKLHKLLPVPPEMPTGLMGEALAAVAPFAAFLVGDTAPEATAREAAALLRAPQRLWGGPAQVGELCRRKAAEAGAQLFPDACSALRLEKKGVSFLLGGSEVRASAVILACDAETVDQLCEGGGRQERSLADEAGKLRAAHKLVLAHFVVRQEGLPLALEDTALILGQAGPLLMSSQPARKARGETAGERLLTVARVAPKGDTDGPALLALVRSALEPVLPFFERHVLHQSADMDPAESHPLFAPSEDGEPLGLRPISRTHERVLFASAGAYPGFGLEGSLVAARACAAHAYELSGRRSVQAT